MIIYVRDEKRRDEEHPPLPSVCIDSQSQIPNPKQRSYLLMGHVMHNDDHRIHTTLSIRKYKILRKMFQSAVQCSAVQARKEGCKDGGKGEIIGAKLTEISEEYVLGIYMYIFGLDNEI